jgi:hypothetical protein
MSILYISLPELNEILVKIYPNIKEFVIYKDNRKTTGGKIDLSLLPLDEFMQFFTPNSFKGLELNRNVVSFQMFVKIVKDFLKTKNLFKPISYCNCWLAYKNWNCFLDAVQNFNSISSLLSCDDYVLDKSVESVMPGIKYGATYCLLKNIDLMSKNVGEDWQTVTERFIKTYGYELKCKDFFVECKCPEEFIQKVHNRGTFIS